MSGPTGFWEAGTTGVGAFFFFLIEVGAEAHEVRDLAQGLSMASWDSDTRLCDP